MSKSNQKAAKNPVPQAKLRRYLHRLGVHWYRQTTLGAVCFYCGREA